MGQQAQRRGSRTLLRRMLVFLLAILLVQALIFLAIFFGSGVLNQTERNAFYILSERTAYRKLDLENDMIQRWSNVKEGKMAFLDAVGEVLERHGTTAAELAENQALCQEILEQAAPSLVDMLRRNSVTDVFAVLDCPNETADYPGIFIRDYDPANYASDNADLLLERGLPQIARSLSIPMDSYWSALFRFGEEVSASENFFSQPIDAIKSVPASERQASYFYHWNESFALSPMDRPIITYSIPLVWEDGTVLGVLGIGITIDYLAEQLKYSELGDNQSGAYFLGLSRDGGKSYRAICTSGPMFKAYFGQASTLTVEPDKYSGIVRFTGESYRGETAYGALQPLKLYNNNTPFEHEEWALIGIQSEAQLLRFSNQVRAILLFTAGVSFLLGLVLVCMAARSFTRPISRLVSDLRRSDPNKPISLQRINITELDTLSQSIEELSNAAAAAASHTSKIIAMSHIPIGVFEYGKRTKEVFCSRSLFELLGWPEQPEEDTFLSEEEFLRRLQTVTSGRRLDRDGDQVFRISHDGRERWVQLFYREENESALGVFLDVTADVEAKRKIEYERDYDILTGLYNRRAFDRQVSGLLLNPEEPIKAAALMMLDLDNLKYVNDSYGHDYGDRYIQSFSHCLQYFRAFHAVVGRRSGDEFNVFLYGFNSEEELRAVTAKFWERLQETTSILPGGGQIKVRCSGGMAWYGKDTTDYTELLRLADFAMYNVKHTAKGAFREFDRVNYAEKSILIQGQDALNRMLESRMVRYALQPIVSARDGSVYGYEFLMRPMMEQLNNVDDVYRLAKNQSKLQQLEQLTWSEAMGRLAFLVRTGQIPPHAKAFINSVGNQQLPEPLLQDIERLYGDILSRVVLEVTEREEVNREISLSKKARVKAWNGLLALDDYGTGYSSESVLVDLSPDLVKLDVNMIRRIDSDSDRLALVCNLIRYAKSRNILVLAEGVESAEELDTLIASGVDYLQGYYLARPDFGVPRIPDGVAAEIRAIRQKYFPDRD